MMVPSSRTASNDPETGVHKPANRSIPTAIPSASREAGPIAGPMRSLASPRVITIIPATSRNNRRPAPGAPRANVEKRRRNWSPNSKVPDYGKQINPKKGGRATL